MPVAVTGIAKTAGRVEMSKMHGTMRLACLLLLVVAGACEDFDLGPDLVVEVFSPQGAVAVEISDPLTACADDTGDPFTLQATTGNPAFCCCRVAGRVVNESTVPIHALLKFHACEDGELFRIGTAVEFVAEVVPGEDRQFSATGLLMPCDDIDRVKLVEVDLNGVVFP